MDAMDGNIVRNGNGGDIEGQGGGGLVDELFMVGSLQDALRAEGYGLSEHVGGLVEVARSGDWRAKLAARKEIGLMLGRAMQFSGGVGKVRVESKGESGERVIREVSGIIRNIRDSQQRLEQNSERYGDSIQEHAPRSITGPGGDGAVRDGGGIEGGGDGGG